MELIKEFEIGSNGWCPLFLSVWNHYSRCKVLTTLGSYRVKGALNFSALCHYSSRLFPNTVLISTVLVLVSGCIPTLHVQILSFLQVLRSGRRAHINIPHTCWGQMADVFTSYAREMPLSSEESAASGSEND